MNQPKFQYTVREQLAAVSMADFLRDCVDVPRFLACCQACPNYGEVWSCPPYEFDPMELWRRYHSMLLYARILVPAAPNQDARLAVQALYAERTNHQDHLLHWEAALPGSLALAGGSCLECARCGRKDGIPCRHPDRMRYSLESLGGDVEKAARRWLGKSLLWIRDGVVPEYLVIAGALLLPPGKAVQTVE